MVRERQGTRHTRTQMEILQLQAKRPPAKLRRSRTAGPRTPTGARRKAKTPPTRATRKIRRNRAVKRRRDFARSFPGREFPNDFPAGRGERRALFLSATSDAAR